MAGTLDSSFQPNYSEQNLEMTLSIKEEDLAKELLIDIEENLEPEPSPECCIYRVPKHIRGINSDAYTPHLISIGPLHHGKDELAAMEKHKTRYMKSFLKRIAVEKREEILTFVKKNEQRIRSCYAEISDLQSLEFVRLILYDAVFIIELFLRHYNCETNDSLLVIRVVRFSLYLDLYLLENQLPFFVLEELYKLTFDNLEGHPTFRELAYEFSQDSVLNSIPDEQMEIKHFTDLRRSAILRSNKPNGNGHVEDLPCAVKLHEAGVKFKKNEGRGLLDIRFEKRNKLLPWFRVHELQIPRLVIADETEFLLRNVMALEQCHYPSDTRVCNYVTLMDFLINTEKDVELLVGEGIISNLLGDNAPVANMFNKLCSRIALSNNSGYHNMSVELKRHCKNPWNRTKATLKSVYFSNLWRGTGTVAAIILLLLTVIQTLCSIKQVIRF